MYKNSDLTAIIIAKNESELIGNCINSLAFANSIIVIDNDSTDDTAQISKKLGVRVIPYQSRDFADLRNFALAHVKTDWLIYIDADERVTPTLARSINKITNTKKNNYSAAAVHRQNYFYGQIINYTGYQTDQILRLFNRKDLIKWQGEVHETPIYSGNSTQLKGRLIHLTHRHTSDNLLKSASWTAIEARLLAASPDTRPVGKFTLIRKSSLEFFRRYFRDQGYKDGMTGFIESLTQALNKAMIYMQVWELQQQPSIDQQYLQIEAEIIKDWQAEEFT